MNQPRTDADIVGSYLNLCKMLPDNSDLTFEYQSGWFYLNSASAGAHLSMSKSLDEARAFLDGYLKGQNNPLETVST